MVHFIGEAEGYEPYAFLKAGVSEEHVYKFRKFGTDSFRGIGNDSQIMLRTIGRELFYLTDNRIRDCRTFHHAVGTFHGLFNGNIPCGGFCFIPGTAVYTINYHKTMRSFTVCMQLCEIK